MSRIGPFLLFLIVIPLSGYGQEDAQAVYYGRRYLDINLHSLDKYAHRIQKQQQRLLKKLTRKEHKLAAKLKRTDSAAYAQYQQQELSYDSIGRMLQPDSSTLAAKAGRTANRTVDSLKAVQGFIQSKAGAITQNTASLDGYDNQLGSLQQKLNYNDYINTLISKRTNSLKNINGGNVAGMAGIDKDIFYAKARMNEWKKIADDPSLLEDKALEYLQGTEGFDQALNKATNNTGDIQPGMSADELEKMGYQTKRQVNAALKEKFGGSLGQVQQQAGGQVSDWQSSFKDLKQTTTDIKQTGGTAKQLKRTGKPSFKINPMRGLPFWQRIEKQYSFQTTRATADRPAILQVAGMAGFKHTPKLSYGLGLAASFGLGQNWSNIHFSFEGITLRSYAQWQLIYGIGAYAGYERSFRSVGNVQLVTNNELPQTIYNTHNTAAYSESVLLGLTKSYKINSKWNGAIQLLYDIWWREKGLKSPLVLRFVTTK